MSRSFTSNFKNELSKTDVHPVYLAELNFENETERFTTHIKDIQFDSDNDNVGEVFKGVGDLGSIDQVRQDKKTRANGLDLSLSGIEQNRLSDVLGVDYQYRKIKVWLGFLDDSDSLITDPYEIFNGYMDMMSIDEGGESASVTVRCESRLIELKNPNIRRYTNPDQQQEFPNDVGFEYVPDIQDKKIVWGKGTIGPQEGPSVGEQAIHFGKEFAKSGLEETWNDITDW